MGNQNPHTNIVVTTPHHNTLSLLFYYIWHPKKSYTTLKDHIAYMLMHKPE